MTWYNNNGCYTAQLWELSTIHRAGQHTCTHVWRIAHILSIEVVGYKTES
jgi:hypothetical protein